MTDRITWQDAFRKGKAPAVVRALCEAWEELIATSSDTFHAGAKEPDLTVLLGEHLRAIKARTRLTGMWSYEQRMGTLKRVSVKGLRVTEPKRTDIHYFSDKDEIDLVFEFKKLDHTPSRRNNYTGSEGMDRFVTGQYSLGHPAAMMVGILLEHHDDCVPPLMRWLNGADAKLQLHMETVNGQQTRSPSAIFPDHSPFDTEHMRPPGKGPAHHTILISHLFLGFPNPPRAIVRRQRRQSLIAALEDTTDAAAEE